MIWIRILYLKVFNEKGYGILWLSLEFYLKKIYYSD